MAPTPPKAPAPPQAPASKPAVAPTGQEAPAAVDGGIKYCAVCGQGSHRTDWIKKLPDGGVACDSHTQEEIAKHQAQPKVAVAVAGQQAGAPAAPPSPSAPSTKK